MHVGRISSILFWVFSKDFWLPHLCCEKIGIDIGLPKSFITQMHPLCQPIGSVWKIVTERICINRYINSSLKLAGKKTKQLLNGTSLSSAYPGWLCFQSCLPVRLGYSFWMCCTGKLHFWYVCRSSKYVHQVWVPRLLGQVKFHGNKTMFYFDLYTKSL